MWYDKFKVGQRVRVVKKVKRWDYGIRTGWTDNMDKTLNKIYEIIDIVPPCGYLLKTNIGAWGDDYYYPVESLRSVAGEQLVFSFMRTGD